MRETSNACIGLEGYSAFSNFSNGYSVGMIFRLSWKKLVWS